MTTPITDKEIKAALVAKVLNAPKPPSIICVPVMQKLILEHNLPSGEVNNFFERIMNIKTQMVKSKELNLKCNVGDDCLCYYVGEGYRGSYEFFGDWATGLDTSNIPTLNKGFII